MREILFRGQTRRRGEKVRMGDGKPIESNWVYGGIFPQNKGGDFSIIYSYEPIEKHVVYAETVCQYTGLTDKNEKKIWENDIVIVNDILFLVCWNEKFSCWYLKGLEHNHRFGESVSAKDCEVVGNIFDNPNFIL